MILPALSSVDFHSNFDDTSERGGNAQEPFPLFTATSSADYFQLSSPRRPRTTFLPSRRRDQKNTKTQQKGEICPDRGVWENKTSRLIVNNSLGTGTITRTLRKIYQGLPQILPAKPVLHISINMARTDRKQQISSSLFSKLKLPG